MASFFAKFATLGGLALLVQITGLLLFVFGFFPVKPTLDGVRNLASSGTESFNPGCQIDDFGGADKGVKKDESDSHERNVGFPAKYDRLVFMVVDGLPAEFVLGKDGKSPPTQDLKLAMPYTQNLLATGSALGYHSKAAPPTVTMPRLKAMTSGAISGFLDVAYNFNTKELLEDNLIGQLARAGWRMVMLGDETWLKLFPNRFERHDGVSSFYVKDTVEVDNNVTRHLDLELEKTDWNLLILHYLGLDHVGHLGGRRSPLMASKLREMDTVIARIYETVLSKYPLGPRTLLVVASDHGMTDSGNHGGATFQETDALSLFITKSSSEPEFQTAQASVDRHQDNVAYQVDLVPTLALLLGIPIPKNNVGALLQPLFSASAPKLQLRALELNSWQLLRIVRKRSPDSVCLADICQEQNVTNVAQSSVPSKQGSNTHKFCTLFNVAVEKHKQWAGSGEGTSEFEEAKEAYLQFLKSTSVWLASGSTEKRQHLILGGGSLLLLSTMVFMIGVFQLCKMTSGSFSSKSESSENVSSLLLKLISVGGVCVHAASFGSSSFVEEEQFTWHFMLSTLFVGLIRVSLQQLKLEHTESLDVETKLGNLDSVNSDGVLADRRRGGNRGSTMRSTEDPSRRHLQTTIFTSTVKEILHICLLLILGRTLRSWHRSGVNWAHLPDVAKALENTDPSAMAYIRAVCLLSVTFMCCWSVPKSLSRFTRRIIAACLILSAVLILFYYLCDFLRLKTTLDARDVEVWATICARGVYGLLSTTSLLALSGFPWMIISESLSKTSSTSKKQSEPLYIMRFQEDPERWHLESVIRRSINATGTVFVSCWCLLQLLLQQPVNAAPVLLLLLQLVMTVNLFRKAQASSPRWISILTLHWLGASGHFGLGNSNTLATVDVAGAYIGLSSHSTVLSGVLAFSITYGSPILYMQGLLLTVNHPGKAQQKATSEFSQLWLLENILLPCYLPMAMNSIVLTAFTGILYLMQDHLFVWSVFSPKYLYIVATTVCTYIGTLTFAAVGGYSFLVISRNMHQAKGEGWSSRMD